MVKFLFAASLCLLSAPAVAHHLPINKIGEYTGRTNTATNTEVTTPLVEQLEFLSMTRLYTAPPTLIDSVRKKPSTLVIKVFAEKITQPLHTAMVLIQSRATGKSDRFTLLNGKLERTFTTPDELLIEVSADGYKTVKRSMTIAVSTQGNRYEFDAELDPAPIVLIVLAIDSRTKKPIHDAHFTISGKAGKTTLLLTPDSTTGVVKTELPGKGIYQLTSSANGYGDFTKSIKLDSVQSEARVMLTPKRAPDVTKVQALPEAVVKSAKSPVVEASAIKPAVKPPVSSASVSLPAVTNSALGLPEKGRSVQLRNIYFDQSSPVLRPESNPELDQLYDMLTQHPSMRIEIRGHTDNQGDFDSNVKLSRERCQAVIDYLAGKGIRKDRLNGIGRGPINPVAPNSSEENRRKNRRVEFIIL